jgi:FAD/FMN-containing dehydrogenase/Fe-S oxidoreductase
VEFQTDELTRRLYANDASMYEEVPKAVAFPETAADIAELVRLAEKQDYSITARAAGTSLAGQTTGGSLVMDVSRFMNGIIEINEQERWARVEPGVIRDSLNREAAKFGLQFGPDTSTTNRCMIGGMIGNNSSGSFSFKYGTTREHVLEMDVVLSDGSEVTFKALNDEELKGKMQLPNLEGDIYRGIVKLVDENLDLIKESYPHPEIIRRNSGYALDKLAEMRPFKASGPDFNLCALLCGSEGTLAMTTSAKLNLVPLPKYRTLIVPHFRTLNEALKATVEITKFDVSAVELVDNVILDATKENIEQQQNRFFLFGEPRCILIVEMEGDDPEVLKSRAEEIKKRLMNRKLGHSYPIITEQEKMKRVWELRKAGLGLLMGLGKDSRTPTFCEDTAVRVQDLPDYIRDFNKILERHNTGCVYYAHASVGELHLRPMLDITTEEGLQKMKVMAAEIADLVKSYRGSLSGEHGDGRARAPFLERVYGPEMMRVLEKVKELFDPAFMFNPAKIIFPRDVDVNLRFYPGYKETDVETVFKWRKAGSFARATELCNGAGVCRKLSESGGTMCPSYMATREEKDSTRGRANVFRQIFAGKGVDAFRSEEIKEALELCLSCKACKSECPANVDMGSMKSEFLNGWHRKNGSTLREKLFANLEMHYKLASKKPSLTNFFARNGLFRKAMEAVAGIDTRRSLPPFAEETFQQWWLSRKNRHKSSKRAILFVDLFTNYHEPEIARSAALIMEALDWQVEVFSFQDSGRPLISMGFLDKAKQHCHTVIELLSPFVKKGVPVIGLEPSEILTLRDDYLDLCDDHYLHAAKTLADHTMLFEEFLLRQKERILGMDLKPLNQKVLLHGHCHQKALLGNRPTIEMLQIFGFDVEDLLTGCCGMAGSFGYEKEKYDLSMDIAELKLFPALREKGTQAIVAAPGFSCRHQILDGVSQRAYHPVELVYKRFESLG